uniref:SUEL-type lectin domain-containing protein n=1 Tax=Anopheles atroparvus TaxID=41427 RepID=A0A182ITI4_ANOAO
MFEYAIVLPWVNYSLLQTVVEACQKKRHCKFLASPKTFGGDPCPGQRKFVEVAYKCRPYEFRSKIACENDVIQLICNPYSRIAIYSANYGRTEYESLQCSQPQGVKEENCLASYATETVMQKCHGRRKCTLSADSTTFGKPCRPDSRMKVLKDRFDSAPEPDEPLQSDLEQDQDELYDEDQFFRESDAVPPGPAPKLQGGPTNGGRVSDVPIFAGVPSSTAVAPPRSVQDIIDEGDFPFGGR